LVADYVLDKARRVEQDAIDPPFRRSLELLPRLASGRLLDALAWVHTSPEYDARRAAALEARKNATAAPAPDQSVKEKP
jgi:hypothetical protein